MTGAQPPDEAAVLAEAVAAAQLGDEDAFRSVYRALQPILMRYLRVLVGDEAEDVASEAWLQIARDLGRFRGDWDKFRGWAATIARHRALDHLRATRRRPAPLGRPAGTPSNPTHSPRHGYRSRGVAETAG